MPQKLLSLLFLTIFSQIILTASAAAQTNNSRLFDERFVIQAVRTVHSAQATYQATVGAGAYGTLAELREANLIDAGLASGEKYGYLWVLQKTPPTATVPAKFTLTATPRRYPKTGRTSYFIDESGEMRGAERGGAIATVEDPAIDSCAILYGNERCVISQMRTLHGAQMTYQATAGFGNFGTLTELYSAGLLSSSMADGTNHGYNFVCVTIGASGSTPAFFRITAVPANYGVTGLRSFYVDAVGVLRGADHQGAPADENDPPVNN